MTEPSILVMGTSALHDLVQTDGSLTVNRYMSALSSIRVKRSISCRFLSINPGNPNVAVPLSVRFFVSTTSVSPSQRPRESPVQDRSRAPQMRAAVKGDDARVVHHLVDDHDVAGPL